jgi:Lon protease-like protein
MASAESAPPAQPPATLVLPIFPLPDVTFFPHTFMPLHVFEARYRAMVTDALARDRRLCVVRLLPGYEQDYDGKPSVAAVAGAGEIVRCERLATGRFNILVRGLWRVQIERELPTDTLYRVVLARRLAEAPLTVDLAPTMARIRAVCGRLLHALDRPADVLEGALSADQPAAAITDRVAAAFLPDVALRQELLETIDVGRRAERVAAALDALLEDLGGGAR